jgi:hypothetical protein
MKQLWKYSVFCPLFILVICCGVDREDQISYLTENLENLENLRQTIESRYAHLMRDTSYNRNRIVFLNCDEEGNLSPDYFCEDVLILKMMEDLELREISFEKQDGKPCSTSNIFNAIYFQRKKSSYYPVVYYYYEYCGTSEPVETKTIFYNPINSNWSVYIDSNYP